jgi:hypothetical protein
MALPSRDQTFAFEHSRDLLDKLVREIGRYREVDGNDEVLEPAETLTLVDQLKDSAFNAAVTAWHLCDWVFNDLPPARRQKLELTELPALQNFARTECRALHLCRQAATASKHWHVRNYPDPTVRIVVTGETGWTIYFVDGEIKIAAVEVFQSAYDFWKRFVRENCPGTGLEDPDVKAALLRYE